MKSRLRILICLLLPASLIAAGKLSAAQISWSSVAPSADTDSTGAPLSAEWIFELGAFIPGFAPTPANKTQWAANWATAARAVYDPVNRAFTGPRFTFSSNAAPYTTTNRGWIWGYHPVRGEWILLGDSTWLWPSASSPGSLPTAWETSAARETITGTLGPAGRMTTAPAAGPLPPMTWTAWQAIYFNSADRANAAVGGPDADPDGDRIPNAVEFLTGSAPRTQGALPAIILPGTGVEIARAPSAQGTMLAEVSSNLQQWTSGAGVQSTPLSAAVRFTPVLPALFENRAFWRFRASLP